MDLDDVNEKTFGIIQLLFYYFKIRGFEFFRKATQMSWLNLRFACIYKHLSLYPDKYDNTDKFRTLYNKSGRMSNAVRKRYLASVL
jgi:hypothetical protein